MAERKAREKKEKKPLPMPLRVTVGVVSVAFAGAITAITGLAALKLTDGPVITLTEDKVSIEAGESFHPEKMLGELTNVTVEEVTIDPSDLDTNVPGTYEISYTVDRFLIPHRMFEKCSLDFLSPGYSRADLTVEVTDTMPPVLNLVSDTLDAKAGEIIKVEDLVKSTKDLSKVTLSFKSGKTDYVYNAKGEKTLTVVAEDASGNRTQKEVKVNFYVDDETAPVFDGVTEKILQVGEPFDPYEGVSVKDDFTENPVFTVEPETVDTSKAGNVILTYRAVDENGNVREEKRNVVVYDAVAGNGEARFGVFWDTKGRADQPYLVAVNRVKNVVTVYGKDAAGNYTVPEKAFTCSIGTATPAGTFVTGERMRWHELFANEYGQYAIRITGHILFHSVPYYVMNEPSSLLSEEYNKLGEAASLGCIRLSVADEKWLFENCPTGFTCVLYDDAWSNGPLGKPETIKIDLTDLRTCGWDPTDPDPNNPWNTAK